MVTPASIPAGLTADQAALLRLLDEAAASPYAAWLETERVTLEPYLYQPELIDAYEPLQVARQNLEAGVAAGRPDADDTMSHAGATGLRANVRRFWGAGRMYRESAAPRSPVTLCPSCEFRTATILPSNLDPKTLAETSQAQVMKSLFKSPLEENGSGPYAFALAEAYHVSEDARTYTIYLRKDVRWSDGAALSAQDFVYTIQRHVTAHEASLVADHLKVIANAPAYLKGELTDFSRVGVKALDAHTLQIQLTEPSAIFVHMLASPVLAPLPRHAIARHGTKWTRPGNIVVSGAYTLAEEKYREQLLFVPNPQYYRADQVQLGRIIYFEGEQSTQVCDWYEIGKVHYVDQIPPARLAWALKEAGFDIVPKLCNYHYVMNSKRFTREERRHLALAFDRLKLVKQVVGMGESPAYGFIPPVFQDSLGYVSSPETAIPHDAIKAHQYFETHPLTWTLRAVYNSSDLHTPIAAFFQEQMVKLGINVHIENMEFRTMLNMARTEHDFDFLRGAWCADYPDPYDFLKIFVTGADGNFGEYSNPGFDALVAQIEIEPDPARRNQLLHQAEGVLAEDPPAIPFYFYKFPYLVAPAFTGLRHGLTGDFLWEHLRTATAE